MIDQDEMRQQLTAMPGVEAIDGGNFAYHPPHTDSYFVLRPLPTCVLTTSTMGVAPEVAMPFALSVLDFAAELPVDLSAPIAKHPGFRGEGFGFDAVALRGPSVKPNSGGIPKADFLYPLAVAAYAVYDCEWCGDETLPEAQARLKWLREPQLGRQPVPALGCRFRKANGRRSSNKFFGVDRYDQVRKLVAELPRDGGSVEVENFERAQVAFLGESNSDILQIAFDGEQRECNINKTLEFLEALAFHGLDSARSR